ncbi:beta-N-acetylhexosaminidase [Paenibacillus sp. strain BS8-2]
MYKLSLAVMAALVAVTSLVGCGKDGSSNSTVTPTSEVVTQSPNPTSHNETPSDQGEQAIWQQINAMSTKEKVGQLAIIGLDGISMNDTTRSFIRDYHVGGFILFKDNIKDASQTLQLLNQLKESNASDPESVPLWLSVDQEGGKVSRLPAEYTKTPTAKQIASKQNPDYTFAIGQSLGLAVRSLGFNMDFAPVLDINSNPDNPVIGDRSFGADADTVASHGLAMMDGITSQGVAAVVKHFPGHGDTAVDSHKSLPIVNKSLEELRGFELRPFEEAIRNEADAIMIGHLLMNKLDKEHPASISKVVITDLLREQLHYDGVVITDDMTMKGLTNGNDIGAAAVDAILAGGDILLVCHEDALQKKVLDSVLQRVDDGTISQERLDESVYRILRLKDKYNLSDDRIPSVDPAEVNADIADYLAPFKG